MAENVVKTATGEDIQGLAIMIAGAVFGPAVAEMTIGRVFPDWDPAAQGLVLGGAVAYFTDGPLRKAGQGLALISAVEWVQGNFGSAAHDTSAEEWVRV